MAITRRRLAASLGGVALVTLGLPSPRATAQELDADTETPTVVRAGRLSARLVLDGVLDEADWRTAGRIDDLTMIEPTEGLAPTQATEVRILADEASLLLGFICHDDNAAAIVSYSKARDSNLDREDHLRMVLDTFRDGRSGYVFSINPAGARYDALIFDRGERENSDWDETWEAATRVSSNGWSAEIRIPIRSLRFAAGLDSWGFNIQRRVERLQEVSRWSGARRDWKLTQMSHAGSIERLPDFDRGMGLSIRPSLVTTAGRREADSPSATDLEASLDVTQMLGSGVVGSLTVNTDFAETEVDSRQTNLTRFPLFFPEKRTFFLEGSDIFEFGLGRSRDALPFFSRRIGLVQGQEVPLDVGLKVHGRAGNTNLGALAVHTGDRESLVEGADLGVLRLQQNVLEESSIGMLATVGDPLGGSGAWTAGVDFVYQTSTFRGNRNFLFGVWGLANERDDLTGGDKTATGFKLDYPNDTLDVLLQYTRIGDSFDPSLGFVPRRGVQIVQTGGRFTRRPSRPWLRRADYQLRPRLVTDLRGNWESYRLTITPLDWTLESGDDLSVSITPTGEKLLETFEIVDGITIDPGTYDWVRYSLGGRLAPKRAVSARLRWEFGDFYDGTLDQIVLGIDWNPSAFINLEIDAERNIGSLPSGDFTRDLLGARMAVNVSPDLQVTSFLQYDNESSSIGTNTRLRWTFTPLGELFVIYNYNVVERLDRWQEDTNQLQIKCRYTFRR